MQLLSHFNAAHKKILSKIDEQWPFQFLPEFSSFSLSWQSQEIRIAYDPDLNAMMPQGYKFYGIPSRTLF